MNPRRSIVRTYIPVTSLVLAALATLCVALPRPAEAAIPPPLPTANPLVDQIVEVTPSQAIVGQTVVVRTQPTAAGSFLANRPYHVDLPSLPGYVPRTTTPALPSIYFTASLFGERARALSVTALGNGRYRVVVPESAHSGRMRFETSAGSSYSTVNVTVSRPGYSIVNLSQFSIIRVTIDNVSQLGVPLSPSPDDAENVSILDVPASAGNHTLTITLGKPMFDAVIVYNVSAVATIPTNVIEVGVVLAGEYLTSSPSATVSGTRRTASWQTLVFGAPGAIPTVNGFDFTFDTATHGTTWTFWVGDRPNVIASGPITEPESWPLNPTTLVLDLRRANGTLFNEATIDLLQAFFVVDGDLFELQ